MNRGFAGTDVFGNRTGRPGVSIREVDMGRSGAGARGGGFRGGGFQGGGFRGNVAPPVVLGTAERRRASLGAFEGMSIDPSIPDLCALLKTALAANAKSASEEGPWKDFWDAVDRLRPLTTSAGKWRADVMNQMSTRCPDDVAKLRSMPGARGVQEGCVMVTLQKSPTQIISAAIEPYQTRGWGIVRVPYRSNLAVAELQPPNGKLIQQYEIWACPPGAELPKRTSLSAREAAELGHSISQALAPLRSGAPGALQCVQGAQVDVAVVNRLLVDLEAKASANESTDVTQDQLDAAQKVIECASQAGVVVAPPPAAALPGAGGGSFPWLPVAAVGGAGALALLVL